MNNKTMHNFTIKLRGDNVYDLYVDNNWQASRGCYLNIVEELRNVMGKMQDNINCTDCHCN